MNKILLVMFCMILLVGTVSSLEIDNVQDYNESNREYLITNAFGLPIIGQEIARIKLTSDLIESLSLGYQKVAEFKVENYDNYTNVFNDMEFHNLKKNGELVTRNFDYKSKTIIKVINFEKVCNEFLSLNGTIHKNCNLVENGTKDKIFWKEINKKDGLLKGNITIGIFIEVKRRDKIEWIPTLFGERLTEWAVWEDGGLKVDLLGYYALNKTTGDVIDSQGNFSTLSINNGSIRGLKGKLNNSFYFDGLSDFVNISTNFKVGTFNWSVSLWVNRTNLSQGGAFFEIGEGDGTADGFAIGIGGTTFDSNNGSDIIGLYNGLGWIDTNVKLTDGFHHIVVVINGTGDSSYWLDNSNIFNDTQFDMKVPANFTKIGGSLGGANRFFEGKVDEVGIWNKSLTPTDISLLFNNNLSCGFEDETCGLVRPTVTLNSPINAFNTSNQTIDFNGTVVSTAGVTNVTLFIDGVLNETITTPSSLVGYWNLDDNLVSTNVIDGSGNGNDGTANFNTTNNSVNGQIKSALDFNGTGDYVQTASSNSLRLNDTSFSLALWFKGDLNKQNYSNPSGNQVAFLWQQDEAPGLVLLDTGRARVTVSNGITTLGANTVDLVLDNQWNFVVGTFDLGNNNLSIYLNGEFKSSNSGSSVNNSGNVGDSFRIGRDDAGRFFNGTIDDVRIYNETLNSSQIQDIYDLGILGRSNIGSGGDYLFTKIISEGDHNWTFESCNVNGCTIATTRTFTVDLTNPVLNITFPLNRSYIDNLTTSQTRSIDFNYTVTDNTLGSCIIVNISTGTNISSLTCSNITFIDIYDQYTFRVFANDSFGRNSTDVEVATFDYKILENNFTFTNTTLEGSLETFIYDLNVSAGVTVVSVALIYNGSSSPTTLATSGDHTVSTINFIVPSVSAETNITFNWNITMSDGFTYNSSSHNQTVSSLTIDNCSTNSVVLSNFIMVDE